MVINHLLNGMILQAWSLRGKGLTGTLPGPGAFTPSWSTTSNYGFLGEKHTHTHTGRPRSPGGLFFSGGNHYLDVPKGDGIRTNLSKTNMTMENPPFEDKFSLLKMVDLTMSCQFSKGVPGTYIFSVKNGDMNKRKCMLNKFPSHGSVLGVKSLNLFIGVCFATWKGRVCEYAPLEIHVISLEVLGHHFL